MTVTKNLALIAMLLALPWQASSADDHDDHDDHDEHHVHLYQIGGEGHHEPAEFRTLGNGWSTTSSGTSGLGNPVIATWGIVPDGTRLPRAAGEPNTTSDLIDFLDGVHHGGASPGGADLQQRAWWGLFNSAFERWESVAGITFSYESADDGVMTFDSVGRPNAPGVLGVRADHRIGGHSIDGQVSPTTLAYNYFPNSAEMVLDTDEVNRWSNSSNNYLLFRNTLMHEIGHGLGLNHVESADVSPAPNVQFGSFLMEPFLSSVFDGPQFDDILGAHRLYGDVNEKGVGNQIYQNATDLGTLGALQSIVIGADADDIFVDFNDVDFVSIDDNSDVDFFSFTINAPTLLDITLTPMGPTYLEGPGGSAQNNSQQNFNAAALGDLNLSLIDTDGTTVMELSSIFGKGITEQILEANLPVAGEYFVRVAGSTNAAQMFQLQISSVPEPSSLLLLLGAVGGAMLRQRYRPLASRR